MKEVKERARERERCLVALRLSGATSAEMVHVDTKKDQNLCLCVPLILSYKKGLLDPLPQLLDDCKELCTQSIGDDQGSFWGSH